MWRSSLVAMAAVTALVLSLAECSAPNGVVSSPSASATVSEPTKIIDLSSSGAVGLSAFEKFPVFAYNDPACRTESCAELVVDEAGQPVDPVVLVGAGARVGPALRQQGELALIDGFEPINDPRIALPDGRFLVRGRSAVDPLIPGWYQRNPTSIRPGEPVPEVTQNDRPPVRLFVFDPESGDVTPVSHWPEARGFSTAMTIGSGADIVLDLVVLAGGRTVAYTAGFNGAAYNIAYGLYLAPIPPASAG